MSLLYSFIYLPKLSLEGLLCSSHIFTNNFPAEIGKLNMLKNWFFLKEDKTKPNKKKNPKQNYCLWVNNKLHCVKNVQLLSVKAVLVISSINSEKKICCWWIQVITHISIRARQSPRTRYEMCSICSDSSSAGAVLRLSN